MLMDPHSAFVHNFNYCANTHVLCTITTMMMMCDFMRKISIKFNSRKVNRVCVLINSIHTYIQYDVFCSEYCVINDEETMHIKYGAKIEMGFRNCVMCLSVAVCSGAWIATG